MKTLANCSPIEFLTQTNKIRKSVENWLNLTHVLEIRRTLPDMDGLTAEEKRSALKEQARKNLAAIFDAILDEHPKETAELLCLICFIDPRDMEQHKMTELLGSLNEILSSEEVLGFFASLERLGLMSGSTAANR